MGFMMSPPSNISFFEWYTPEANITIGITKAEAIAYSSARNLIINGTKVVSSGGISLVTGGIETIAEYPLPAIIA